MNRKNIISCLVLILITFVVTHYCTLKFCTNDYKVSLRQEQSRLTVTNFEVIPESKKPRPNMLKPSFYVDVTIDGTLNGGNCYIEYVQKSERIEEIDGKEVMIVEFEPKVSTTMNIFKLSGEDFSETFRYRVNGYADDELTYIFRCGDFEKTVEAIWG